MSKTKVTLRYPTVGMKANEVIEVDAETAKELVENGLASHVKAGSDAKSDKG